MGRCNRQCWRYGPKTTRGAAQLQALFLTRMLFKSCNPDIVLTFLCTSDPLVDTGDYIYTLQFDSGVLACQPDTPAVATQAVHSLLVLYLGFSLTDGCNITVPSSHCCHHGHRWFSRLFYLLVKSLSWY